MVAPLKGKHRNVVKIMTSRRFDDRLEARLRTSHGNDDDDFRLWELRVKAVLRGRDIIDALTQTDAEKKSSEDALAVIITVLGYNLLRKIQDCLTAIEAWEKQQS